MKKIGKEHADLFHELIEGKEQLLRSLDNSKEPEKSLLWTTYFKPSRWSEFSPVVRIEFAHHPSTQLNQVDRAAQLIALLDQDIQSKAVMEPMSQFNADRNAKDVSLATDMIRSLLVSNAGSMRNAVSLLQGYRT